VPGLIMDDKILEELIKQCREELVTAEEVLKYIEKLMRNNA
jgi:hypothetical protein